MGRVVVLNFMSLDGVVQSAADEDEDRSGGFDRGGWVVPYEDEVVAEFMREATVASDAMLLGRLTYEILERAWSQADRSEPAVAAMNDMAKLVVTRSDADLTWHNSHRIIPDFPASLQKAKDEVLGDLLVLGSAQLVRTLARHDLVDSYKLLHYPVLLGAGKRMFDDHSGLVDFRLDNLASSPSGVVMTTYVRTT